MSTYSVSLQSLFAAIEAAQTLGSNITSTLSTLETDASSTLSTWTGAAQASYQTCKANWDNAAALIPGALAAATQTLETIAEQYDGAERAAIATFTP